MACEWREEEKKWNKKKRRKTIFFLLQIHCYSSCRCCQYILNLLFFGEDRTLNSRIGLKPFCTRSSIQTLMPLRHSLLQFILVSLSHIINFIHCESKKKREKIWRKQAKTRCEMSKKYGKERVKAETRRLFCSLVHTHSHTLHHKSLLSFHLFLFIIFPHTHIPWRLSDSFWRNRQEVRNRQLTANSDTHTHKHNAAKRNVSYVALRPQT